MEPRHDLGSRLGIEVAEARDGTARIVMPVSAEALNIGGTVHGGIIATLVDIAVAVACHSLTPRGERRPMATTELNVTYLRAGRQGPLSCTARIRRRGTSLAVGEAEVADGNGRLLAVGRATYLVGGTPPVPPEGAADDSIPHGSQA